MPKSNLSSRIKIAVLNAMQAFGSAASQMARNAKLRVNEINLESRRHEILTEFSLQAFSMWHNGVKLPKELSDMFVELNEIDDKLSVLRAQKYAKVNEESPEAETGKDEASLPTAEEAKTAPDETPAPEAKESAPEAESASEAKPTEAPVSEPKPAPEAVPTENVETPAKPKKAPAVKKRIRAVKPKPKE